MNNDPFLVYKLFKQIQNQQDVVLEGTPEEKTQQIKDMLDNTSEDHPIRANLKKPSQNA